MNQIDRFILNILNLNVNEITSIESAINDNNNIVAHIIPISNIENCPYCDSAKIVSKGYRKITLKTPSSNIQLCKITCSIVSVKMYPSINKSVHPT